MSEFKEPTLWKHQEEGFKRAKDAPEFGFLYEPGVGKTLTTITTLRHKYTLNKRLLRTLVISPLITLDNWKNEWLKYSKITDDRILVLKGPVKKRINILRQQMKENPNFIAITNYDALTSKDLQKILYEWSPEVLVADESQKLKHANGKRAKVVQKIARTTMHRYILTGTMVTKTPLDIFGQFLVLDNGATFGRSFVSFRAKYFFDNNAGMPRDRYFPDWRAQPSTEKLMAQIMACKVMEAKKEDCIDLPDFVAIKINVEFTPTQLERYREMEHAFITELKEDTFAVADLAITKSIRMRQIATGFVKDSEGEIHYIPNNRVAALKELLQNNVNEHGEKVIVWAVYQHNYQQIRQVCKELKIEAVEAHGLITAKVKEHNLREFDTNPHKKVLIANPYAIGIGINILVAGVSIWFSKDFSYEVREQADARNFRGGSIKYHKKITRYDLILENSIDEVIEATVVSNEATALQISEQIKAYYELRREK